MSHWSVRHGGTGNKYGKQLSFKSCYRTCKTLHLLLNALAFSLTWTLYMILMCWLPGFFRCFGAAVDV